MSHNVVLWFLPALFTTEVLFRILSQWVSQKWMLVVVACCASLGLLFYAIGVIWLPMGLNVALIAIVFYAMGVSLKKIIDRISNRDSLWLCICCSVLLIVAGLFGYIDRIDMASGQFGTFGIFLLWATIGIGMTISMSIFINRFALLEYVGRSNTSLVIMCIHGMILRAILFVVVTLTGWDLIWLRNDIGVSLTVTLATIIICLPFVWGYDKYIKRIFKLWRLY